MIWSKIPQTRQQFVQRHNIFFVISIFRSISQVANVSVAHWIIYISLLIDETKTSLYISLSSITANIHGVSSRECGIPIIHGCDNHTSSTMAMATLARRRLRAAAAHLLPPSSPPPQQQRQGQAAAPAVPSGGASHHRPPAPRRRPPARLLP